MSQKTSRIGRQRILTRLSKHILEGDAPDLWGKFLSIGVATRFGETCHLLLRRKYMTGSMQRALTTLQFIARKIDMYTLIRICLSKKSDLFKTGSFKIKNHLPLC